MSANAKKNVIIAAVIVAVLLAAALSLFASVPASAQETVRAAIKCPLYKNPDFSAEIIAEIPQNAEVTPTGEVDVAGFIRTTYGNVSGYVLARNLYRTSDPLGSETVTVRVTSEKLGALVEIKEFPMESRTVASLKDGTKVQKVVGGVEYGDYSEIIYEGKQAFVPTANITDGVTYYQTVVIILCVAAFVLLVCSAAIVVYGKKHKIFEKRGKDGVL